MTRTRARFDLRERRIVRRERSLCGVKPVHERFIEPISRPKGGLEAGSGVSFEAALRDELTDQVIPLEISVQLVEVNTITVQ